MTGHDHAEQAAQKANRESLERGELAILHIPDPQDFRYAATGCLDVPPVEAQIATQEPAGAPGVDSAGRGASAGLGERLRALVAGPHPDMLIVRTAEEVWLAIVEQVDEVEAAYRVADAEIARLSEFHDHYRAQVERTRAQFVRMTKSSDEKTVRHGTALLHILDGKDAP